MSTPREGLSTGVVNGKIYAVGGVGRGLSRISTVEEYNPVTDIWTKKANPIPTRRQYLSASVVNGKIYAIGGGAPGLSTVEMYDPTTDRWLRKADMPTARTLFPASAVNGYIYAIGGGRSFGAGGLPSLVLPTVEEYDTGVGIRVQAISPQEGRTAGGEPISISGSRFPPDAVVTIGRELLMGLKVTDTLITGITPPGNPGEQDLRITSPSHPMSDLFYRATFTYVVPTAPVVSGMTPTNGAQRGGERSSITGNRFQPGATVRIGSGTATDVTVTPTLLTFTIPAGAEGTVDVAVTNADGQRGILRGGYAYNPFPVIERVRNEDNPFAGAIAEGSLSGGTAIVITGQNFIDGAVVEIGGTPVGRVNVVSPTELHVETPPGTAGTKAVTVVNSDGQAVTAPEEFTYNPAPTISSILPNAGALEGGTPMLITGTGFLVSLVTTVTVGGIEASNIDPLSSTGIFVRTPPSQTPGPKDVVVVNRDGQTATLRAGFTYNPGPVIRAITPDDGKVAGGTKIVILGSGFLPGAEVGIGDAVRRTFLPARSVVVESPIRITAVTPELVGAPGPRDVVVQNPDRQVAVVENGFIYNPPPEIRDIRPPFGSTSGGARIVITGRGFLPGTQVVIGKRPAEEVDVRDDRTIEVITPRNRSGFLDVRVINLDTQEAVVREGFHSVGELVYNYPNPFRPSQGTTFRYVTSDPIREMRIYIFNLAGEPLGAVRQSGGNEVRWVNSNLRIGLLVYLVEAEMEDGTIRRFRRMLEIY